VSKHIELWAMNVFNEWRSFCGFDTTKFVIDLFEDEGLNWYPTSSKQVQFFTIS
jgi:hypothetical protein